MKIDILLVLTGIENYVQLLEDYRYVVENFSNPKPLTEILEVIGSGENETLGGFDTTTDDSYHRYYTFDSRSDGTAKYLGLCKC